MHWTRQRSISGLSNTLIPALTDPFSGQPALKSSDVSAQRYDAKWYVFAASQNAQQSSGDYAAVARSATGWQGEFAGATPPQDWEDIRHSHLLAKPAQISPSSKDQETQTTRIALHEGDTLIALMFASPNPVRLARSHAVSLIGTDTPALTALAGRVGAGQPDAGQTLCACMNVGINTVRGAIQGGANTVEKVGEVHLRRHQLRILQARNRSTPHATSTAHGCRMSLAPYVRIVAQGKGRARSLTLDEAEAAMSLILSKDVAPEALGALLMVLRLRGETDEEIAGFTSALRRSVDAKLQPADLDWPCYAAGRTRGAPLFLLAAKLVANAGYSVSMHGWNSHQNTAADLQQAMQTTGRDRRWLALYPPRHT